MRSTCLRCRRPSSACWCAQLPTVPTTTQVIIVQHPRERYVAIGTARMTHLSLVGSRLIEGTALDDHPALQDIFDEDTAVLYPGETARPFEEWLAKKPRRLVVVDGTWSQAKKLLRLNPRLAALPRLSFQPSEPGRYRIRKEPTDQHLSTVEATAAVLGALEGEPERFAALLQPFTWMVDHQIASETRHRGGERVRRFVHRRGRTALPELEPLLENPECAVLVYAEGNSQPGLGPPELAHLVASRPLVRPASRLDLVVAPRLPLHPTLAARIGVAEATLRAGVDVDTALAAFASFAGGDQIVCWGSFARDLLHDAGMKKFGFIDVRALAARQLRRSAGGLSNAATSLGVDVAPAVDAAGDPIRAPRAVVSLRALEGILGALLRARAADPSRAASSPRATVAAEPQNPA
jgi:DTW domain-containing protein YfiP